jgi:hypothetical protein
LRKKKTVTIIILLFGLISFFLFSPCGDLQAAQKKRGAINVTLGGASSKDNLSGDFSMVKGVGWNFLSGWMSAGINLGMIKKEFMATGNLNFHIPLGPIEPYATAGYGIILQTFFPIGNYGGGIRISIKKSFGIVGEYRKIRYKNRDRYMGTKSTVDLDYYGAGLFYYF